MVAGVTTPVVSAYKNIYKTSTPALLLKTVLMNVVQNMGYNELSQRVGFVDAYRAVSVLIYTFTPLVYSRGFLSNHKDLGGS